MAIKPDTKNLLASSLEKLLECKSFESITIQEIVKGCGASRAAFYRHFHDKQDLMQWFFRSQMEDGFTGYLEDLPKWDLHCARTVMIMYKHRNIMQKLVLDKGQNSFTEFLFDTGITHTTNCTRAVLHIDKLPVDISLSIKVWVGGVTYLMTEWIERGFQETPESVADAIVETLPYRLKFIFTNSYTT